MPRSSEKGVPSHSLVLPLLLNRGWSFPTALGSMLVMTAALFGLLGLALKPFGIKLW